MAYKKKDKGRHIDGLGRVVLPKLLRDKLNFSEQTDLDFAIKNNCITIKRSPKQCALCDSKKDVIENIIGDTSVCRSCCEKIVEKMSEIQ